MNSEVDIGTKISLGHSRSGWQALVEPAVSALSQRVAP